MIGAERSVEDVTEEVLQDRVFFEESGGGVTLGGGDPLFQPLFSRELMLSFQDNGLHVALDTAGYSGVEEFESLTSLADLVLLDLKLMDPDQHRAATGVPVEPVLRNARWLGAQSTRVWVRTPVIPGFTDSAQNISAIALFIREHLPLVERWDLLGFNNLCVVKWERLGMEFPCRNTPLATKAEMGQLVEVARESNVPIISWSGVVDDTTASS
jgi:pyruvate formate lyase activating enzyme